jgi:hypothetical protein
MPVAMDIRSDISGAQEKLRLHQQAVMTAAVRSMNRTSVTVRKDASNGLQEFYPGMKVSALKARLKMTKATRNKPEARLDPTKGRIPMMGNFGMTRRGRFGVYFSKLPWRMETPDGEIISAGLLKPMPSSTRYTAGGSWCSFVSALAACPSACCSLHRPPRRWWRRAFCARMYKRAREVFDVNFARELAYAKSRKDNE